ncbi:MAG: glycosyltransferase [Granulosicoccus sp.]
MKIGYISKNYSTKRNIIGKVPDIEYVYRVGANQIANFPFKAINRKVSRKLFGNVVTSQESYHLPFPVNRPDVYHYFNSVGTTSTPWCTTFETIVPRTSNALTAMDEINEKSDSNVGTLTKRLVKLMASDRCIGLIPMSQNAYQIQESFLSDFAQEGEAILKKTQVIQPPQKLLIDERDKQTAKTRLSFIFVANDFVRKGGYEVIEAFRVLKEKYDLHLTVVSKLIGINKLTGASYQSYPTAKELKKTIDLLQSSCDWLTFYNGLPNDQVLQQMKKAHIGLLPTRADSYGYSVLEFQAAGCPVISTNIRALSELNNENLGWIVEAPKLQSGNMDLSYRIENLSSIITKGIISTVEGIYEQPETVVAKTNLALEKIRRFHNPQNFSANLVRIYEKAGNLSQ